VQESKSKQLSELQDAVVRREKENYELKQKLQQLEVIKDTILTEMLNR
jgi:hypothetical protein